MLGWVFIIGAMVGILIFAIAILVFSAFEMFQLIKEIKNDGKV